MKTAISLPDETFEAAETLARKLKISRSELYATAVAEFVAKHRSANITALLNQVYEQPTEGISKALRSAQSRSIGESDW